MYDFNNENAFNICHKVAACKTKIMCEYNIGWKVHISTITSDAMLQNWTGYAQTLFIPYLFQLG